MAFLPLVILDIEKEHTQTNTRVYKSRGWRDDLRFEKDTFNWQVLTYCYMFVLWHQKLSLQYLFFSIWFMWTFGWSISICIFPQADRTTTPGFHHRSLRSRTLRTNLGDCQEDFGATTPGWTSKKNPAGDGRGMKWCAFLLQSFFEQKKSEKMGRLVVFGVLEQPF